MAKRAWSAYRPKRARQYMGYEIPPVKRGERMAVLAIAQHPRTPLGQVCTHMDCDYLPKCEYCLFHTNENNTNIRNTAINAGIKLF